MKNLSLLVLLCAATSLVNCQQSTRSSTTPKPDSISSPGSKTMPSCAAFSILRRSPRGSLPYENPSHFYRGPYALRLHRGGSPFPLPGGHAFWLLHLPAVPRSEEHTSELQ